MKLGILGKGMIVSDFLETVRQLPVEWMSLLGTERSGEQAVEFGRRHGMRQVYFAYEELLESEIDTVYVALPNHLHFSCGKRALEAGKNVILEKPATSNAGEFRELMRLARERGCFLFEAVSTYHLPAFLALKREIGNIGRLRLAVVQYSQRSSRYDAFRRGEILPVFDCHKSGGALMDINFYPVSTLVGLFGRPERVSYRANVERGIDTSGIVTMEYPDFQAAAIGAKDCGLMAYASFLGDEGRIQVDEAVSRFAEYTVFSGDGSEERYVAKERRHRMYYEFKEFERIVREADRARHEELLQLSLDVAEVLEEARRSAGVVFDADHPAGAGEAGE